VNDSHKRLTGCRCRCGECGQHFNRTSTFTAHRIGAFGTVRNPGDRRCLTAEEMQARGWRLNSGGFWVTGMGRPEPRIGRRAPVPKAPPKPIPITPQLLDRRPR
jgi:hypothetical protein